MTWRLLDGSPWLTGTGEVAGDLDGDRCLTKTQTEFQLTTVRLTETGD
jgi:hypothetical protein